MAAFVPKDKLVTKGAPRLEKTAAEPLIYFAYETLVCVNHITGREALKRQLLKRKTKFRRFNARFDVGALRVTQHG